VEPITKLNGHIKKLLQGEKKEGKNKGY